MTIFEQLSSLREAAERERNARRPLHDAQIMTLREIYERYARVCPFGPGELVTPLKGQQCQKNAGEPHIVLEVRTDAPPHFSNDQLSSSMTFGARHDMRVAVLMGDDYCAFWVESWHFEAWRG